MMSQETKIVYHELFSSLPTVDFSSPQRKDLRTKTQKERDTFVKSVYENTVKLLALDHFMPIKDEHMQLVGTNSFGQILDVSLEQRQEPTPHYVIIGKLELSEHFQKIMAKPHGVSVEIPPDFNIGGYTGKDESLNYPISGCVMSNKTAVAMPQLREVANFNSNGDCWIYTFYEQGGDMPAEKKDEENDKKPSFKEKVMGFINSFKTALEEEFPESEPASDDNRPKEDPKMKPKEGFENKEEDEEDYQKEEKEDEEKIKKETEEEFTMSSKTLKFNKEQQKYVNELALKVQTFEAEQAERESEKTEDQKRIESMEAKMAKMEDTEREQTFQALAMKGQISPEQKEGFMAIAKSQSLEFAVAYQEKNPFNAPLTELVGDGNLKNKTNEQLVEHYEAVYADTKDDDLRKQMVAIAVKKHGVAPVPEKEPVEKTA